MLIVDDDITKGTHKTAACGTRNDGFFPGVKKAPGLLVHQQPIAGTAGWQFAVESRVDIRPYKPLA